jgi:hypothetical protein
VTNVPNSPNDNINTLYLLFSVPTNLLAQVQLASATPNLMFVNSFTMTATTCNGTTTNNPDVYTCAGLPSNLNDSNSFGNYAGAATLHGLPAPTQYTILEYKDGAIGHSSTLTFTNLFLPQGTYIVGYGVDAGPANNPGTGFTAFTNAGLVTTNQRVPEPASLVLLGVGFIPLFGFSRRQLHR